VKRHINVFIFLRPAGEQFGAGWVVACGVRNWPELFEGLWYCFPLCVVLFAPRVCTMYWSPCDLTFANKVPCRLCSLVQVIAC